MGDCKTRVEVEADELEVKLNALHAFIDSIQFSSLSFLDRELLKKQQRHMEGYLNILQMRMSAFELGS